MAKVSNPDSEAELEKIKILDISFKDLLPRGSERWSDPLIKMSVPSFTEALHRWFRKAKDINDRTGEAVDPFLEPVL